MLPNRFYTGLFGVSVSVAYRCRDEAGLRLEPRDHGLSGVAARNKPPVWALDLLREVVVDKTKTCPDPRGQGSNYLKFVDRYAPRH